MIIVGWSLTFLLPLALLAFGTGTQGDDGPWMFSFFFLGPTVLFGFLLLAASWRELPKHQMIGLVHFVTLVIGFRVLPGYWQRVTFGGDHLIAGFLAESARSFEAEWWHPLWAPLMTVLVACAVAFNVAAWTGRPVG